mmetsp:Transcript_16766/g.46130  ORF Transcript_16766/g.46130 Transcript_16766/m.46130 type:complete len:365 (-) Transcript_16766:23-1117(-)
MKAKPGNPIQSKKKYSPSGKAGELWPARFGPLCNTMCCTCRTLKPSGVMSIRAPAASSVEFLSRACDAASLPERGGDLDLTVSVSGCPKRANTRFWITSASRIASAENQSPKTSSTSSLLSKRRRSCPQETGLLQAVGSSAAKTLRHSGCGSSLQLWPSHWRRRPSTLMDVRLRSLSWPLMWRSTFPFSRRANTVQLPSASLYSTVVGWAYEEKRPAWLMRLQVSRCGTFRAASTAPARATLLVAGCVDGCCSWRDAAERNDVVCTEGGEEAGKECSDGGKLDRGDGGCDCSPGGVCAGSASLVCCPAGGAASGGGGGTTGIVREPPREFEMCRKQVQNSSPCTAASRPTVFACPIWASGVRED